MSTPKDDPDDMSKYSTAELLEMVNAANPLTESEQAVVSFAETECANGAASVAADKVKVLVKIIRKRWPS